MNAILIVDLQLDFCEGGALPAIGANAIVPKINIMLPHFDKIFASKDWHPHDTVHFDKWPVHCVRGTRGAEFHPDFNASNVDFLCLKGTGNTDDGYSAFEATNIDLQYQLVKSNVTHLYICGLTTEYCIKATAMDAVKLGIDVTVISEAIAAVDASDGQTALEEMMEMGIRVIKSI